MLYVSLKTKQDLDEQELMSNTFFCTWFWPGLLVQKPFAFYLFIYLIIFQIQISHLGLN